MTGGRCLLPILVAATAAAGLAAQAPDLSGTWKLSRASSETSEGAAFVGLAGNAGIPQTLYITQAANGTVIVGSDTNTSHARTYNPGARTVSPLGRGGEITMVSRWDGATLVAEGDDPASKSQIRESISVSADGQTLTVAIVVAAAEGTSASRLVYTKALVEAPCTAWPTPCER